MSILGGLLLLFAVQSYQADGHTWQASYIRPIVVVVDRPEWSFTKERGE